MDWNWEKTEGYEKMNDLIYLEIFFAYPFGFWVWRF